MSQKQRESLGAHQTAALPSILKCVIKSKDNSIVLAKPPPAHMLMCAEFCLSKICKLLYACSMLIHQVHTKFTAEFHGRHGNVHVVTTDGLPTRARGCPDQGARPAPCTPHWIRDPPQQRGSFHGGATGNDAEAGMPLT